MSLCCVEEKSKLNTVEQSLKLSEIEFVKKSTLSGPLDLSGKIKHCIDRDSVMMFMDLFGKPANSTSKHFGLFHDSVVMKV